MNTTNNTTEENKSVQPIQQRTPQHPIYIEKNDNKNLLIGVLIGALVVLVAFCAYLLANNSKGEQTEARELREQSSMIESQSRDKSQTEEETGVTEQTTANTESVADQQQAAAEQKAKATATQHLVGSTQPQSRYQNIPKNEIYEGMYLFSGKIYKYPIVMDLVFNGHEVSGTYYYTKQGSNARLYLQGSIYGNELDIYENNENGEWTGHFYGHIKRGVYSGTFTNSKGKQMSFTISL